MTQNSFNRQSIEWEKCQSNIYTKALHKYFATGKRQFDAAIEESIQWQIEQLAPECSFFENETYTNQGDMRSPCYSTVITWLSEICESFDSDILSSTFDCCGITTTETNVFHRLLKNFIESSRLSDDIINDEGADVRDFNERE